MKRIKLKKRKKFDKINTIIAVIILLFVSIIIVLSYINTKLSPLLFDFAELETAKLANLIINRAVAKQVANELDIEQLFYSHQNKEGEIQTIDFNPAIVNRVLNMITTSVHTSLKAIESGNIDLVEIPENIFVEYDKEKIKKGIVFEIPLGATFNNTFLSNLGPRIPVRLNLIGSINSNINTKISQYGINNALIEVSIKVEVTEKMNLPLVSKNAVISTSIPIALKIVQGKVPAYYSGGLSQTSPIFTLPIN
ncbi:MAG: sporulation protein YunB [Bacilli bacterium]|nr:sporulation protein YunB [Bacilli bacterium]